MSSGAEELYDQALDRMSEGDPRAAMALLQEALAAEPGLLDARHALVRASADAGELDTALRAAEELVERAPEDELAWTSLSIALQRMGRIPEAEAAGTKAKLLGWKRQLREGRGA